MFCARPFLSQTRTTIAENDSSTTGRPNLHEIPATNILSILRTSSSEPRNLNHDLRKQVLSSILTRRINFPPIPPSSHGVPPLSPHSNSLHKNRPQHLEVHALRNAALLPRQWRAHATGSRCIGSALPGPPAQPAEVPVPPAPLQLRWRSHLPVTGGRLALCIRCGKGNTSRAPHTLGALPCPGYCAATGRLNAALKAGMFDACLATAGEATRDIAYARGWSPIPS